MENQWGLMKAVTPDILIQLFSRVRGTFVRVMVSVFN